jgi:hypothetical protein
VSVSTTSSSTSSTTTTTRTLPDRIDDYASSWVDYPNSEFDPRSGTSSTSAIRASSKLVEELGFDAIAINEHHNTPTACSPRRRCGPGT